MKRSVSFLVSLSLLAASAPAIAQDASESSVSSTRSSSSSSVRPCFDQTGTERVICLNQLKRSSSSRAAADRVRRNTTAQLRNDTCRNERGLEKVRCLRTIRIRPAVTRARTQVNNTVKRVSRRLLKSSVKEMRQTRRSARSSRSSMRSSSSSSSSSSSMSSSSSSSSAN